MNYTPLEERTTLELQKLFNALQKVMQKLDWKNEEFWEYAKKQQEIAKILDYRSRIK